LPATSVLSSAVLTVGLLYLFFRVYHSSSNTRHA
jgi:hypothetical protein